MEIINTLYITRGLPGSGKSTAIQNMMAKLLEPWENPELTTFPPSMAWCEADYYHGTPYNWKAENQADAHLFCRLTIKAHLNNKVNYVFVGNTNIKKKDYQPYIDIALDANYSVVFLTPSTPWAMDVDECFRRNVHKVPRETIQRMKDSYEEDMRYPIIYVKGPAP